MRINGEYDNHGLSDEEVQYRNERDEPTQEGLNEGERVTVVEKDMADLILEMAGGML